jgi:hypothetical protein
MFGHSSDQPQPDEDKESEMAASLDAVVNEVDTTEETPSPAPEPTPESEPEPAAPSAPQPLAPVWQHPGAPIDEKPGLPALPPLPPPSSSAPALSDDDSDSNASDDPIASHQLVDLKQKALSQLTPIVGHLDQTPEEKFRTLMMMIQASDDQSLLQEAYDTAQKITDEKTKAQALLDVVNEINYFTQQHKN